MEERRTDTREDKGHDGGRAISIWFFIGALLVVYGAVILGAGIYGLFVPPAHPVVLDEIHFSLWWGGILLLFGLIYVIRFLPKKRDKG